MDRGRPKKKSDGGHHRRTESKRSKSAERRAFETLPKGWRVPDALQMLDPAEAMALKKQAMAQAERFEIMRKVDVDSLSRVSCFCCLFFCRLKKGKKKSNSILGTAKP